MNTIGRKLQLWFGGMGLAAMLAFGLFTVRSSELTIQSDPRDFILRESDLPAAGAYAIPLHERHAISNDLVVYLLGDEAGEARIRRTGRVVGWRVHFVRTALDAAVPENITQTVTQYASAQGARLNLDTYLLSIQNPENGETVWRMLDDSLELGDAARLETRSQALSNGDRQIGYSLNFIYRNMGVRLEAFGNEGQIQLDEVVSLAEVVLARLRAAQPRGGLVPTPTPGFEPPEETARTYR